MFDVGFWELFVIGIIFLLVLGPERLPEFATKAGRYVRKIKTFIENVNTDISSQLETENLKKHLDLEDENSNILEIIKDSKETISDIKDTVEKK
ncbi:Twin-arginine translocation protein TatB [hydrothermal vent metagenome]|uniref:Twin-arginine translocation protein TatB n=1 Tax=hydrothermal vent metagenome TaxID=652676 RepID=A0A1W1CPD5_9ZZZZ